MAILETTAGLRNQRQYATLSDLGGRLVSPIDNAISELERQKEAIDKALASLRGLAAGTAHRRSPSNSAGTTNHKPWRLSAQGRRNIIEAAKKRWAAIHAAKEGAAKKKSAPAKRSKKRVLSAEARKKMAEAAKKRWAAQKKQQAA